MSSEFYALDIDNGDAFLLVTEHNGSSFSVLVDGGKKDKGGPFPLVEAIERADPALDHLSVVICTHSDGRNVIVAQRLERKRSNKVRWDIYKLESDARGNLHYGH